MIIKFLVSLKYVIFWKKDNELTDIDLLNILNYERKIDYEKVHIINYICNSNDLIISK